MTGFPRPRTANMRAVVSLLVLAASCLCMVKGQQEPMPIDSLPISFDEATQPPAPPALPTAPPTPAIPAADDDDEEEINAFDRLETIDNLDDFLLMLRTANGSNVTMNDIYEQENSEEGGKATIYGGRGRMAMPDNCSPRNMTVKLENFTSEPNTIIFPRCTRIERCGGCVKSPYLSCEPAYTERVSLRVLRATQTPGATTLTWRGFLSVLVDRHLRCHLTCQLNQEKCGPLKRFRPAACICTCKNSYQTCAVPKLYNPETCRCECPNINQNCCSGRGRCQLVVDPNTCQCALDNRRRHIGANSDVSLEAIEAYLNATGQESQPPVELELETTTVTTPEPTTTQPTSCETHPCGMSMTPIRRNGRCTCVPSGTINTGRAPSINRNPGNGAGGLVPSSASSSRRLIFRITPGRPGPRRPSPGRPSRPVRIGSPSRLGLSGRLPVSTVRPSRPVRILSPSRAGRRRRPRPRTYMPGQN